MRCETALGEDASARSISAPGKPDRPHDQRSDDGSTKSVRLVAWGNLLGNLLGILPGCVGGHHLGTRLGIPLPEDLGNPN